MCDDKKQILMKNNVMIKAKYNLNTVENRVFQLILFNFQKYNENTMITTITREQVATVINNKSQKNAISIRNIFIKLRKTDIFIETNSKWINRGFINGVVYNKEEDTFTIDMHKEVYNVLIDYLRGYTPVNLATFFSFKSFYGQRMYELLRLWSNTKTIINYKIDTLRELFILENKYLEYKNFKSRVINPAIKELNEKGLMRIDIKEHKIGRKVESIDFIVKDDDKRKYFEKNNDSSQKEKPVTKSTYKSKDKKLKFMNFDERNYSENQYDDMEKKLLGWECNE